jgi:hypothetical protein
MEKCIQRATGKEYWYVQWTGDNKKEVLQLFADDLEGSRIEINMAGPEMWQIQLWEDGFCVEERLLLKDSFIVNFSDENEWEWWIGNKNIFLDHFYPVDSLLTYDNDVAQWENFLRGETDKEETSPLDDLTERLQKGNRRMTDEPDFRTFWQQSTGMPFAGGTDDSRGFLNPFKKVGKSEHYDWRAAFSAIRAEREKAEDDAAFAIYMEKFTREKNGEETAAWLEFSDGLGETRIHPSLGNVPDLEDYENTSAPYSFTVDWDFGLGSLRELELMLSGQRVSANFTVIRTPRGRDTRVIEVNVMSVSNPSDTFTAQIGDTFLIADGMVYDVLQDTEIEPED